MDLEKTGALAQVDECIQIIGDKMVKQTKSVQQPRNPGTMISGSGDGVLRVGDLRDAIAFVDDDVEITFGSTLAGSPLSFYRFKSRGEDLLQIELNEG